MYPGHQQPAAWPGPGYTRTKGRAAPSYLQLAVTGDGLPDPQALPAELTGIHVAEEQVVLPVVETLTKQKRGDGK